MSVKLNYEILDYLWLLCAALSTLFFSFSQSPDFSLSEIKEKINKKKSLQYNKFTSTVFSRLMFAPSTDFNTGSGLRLKSGPDFLALSHSMTANPQSILFFPQKRTLLVSTQY